MTHVTGSLKKMWVIVSLTARGRNSGRTPLNETSCGVGAPLRMKVKLSEDSVGELVVQTWDENLFTLSVSTFSDFANTILEAVNPGNFSAQF